MTGVALGLAFLGGAAGGIGAVAFVAIAVLVRARWGPGRFADRVRVGAVMVVAVGLGTWRQAAVDPVVGPAWADLADAVTGTVASVPTDDGRWQRFDLAVTRFRTSESEEPGETENGWVAARALLRVTAPTSPRVGLGDALWMRGSVRPVEDQAPGYREFLRSRGIGGTVFASVVAIEATGRGWRRAIAEGGSRFTRTLTRAVPGDRGALLTGLVTGDDASLSDPRRDAFRATGTSHVTAVSGSNVGLLVGVLAVTGGSLGWRRRLPWQLLTVSAVWGYALLVGLGPPAVRAALFATGVVIAGRLGRRPDALTLLVLGAAAMAAIRPADLDTLSFRLSTVAALSLAVVADGRRPRTLGAWVVGGLAAAALAQMATLPILVPAFGTVVLTGIPANLLIGPLVAVAFPLAAAAGLLGLVVPAVGDAAAVVAGQVAGTVFAVVDTLAMGGRGDLAVGRPSDAASAVGAVSVLASLTLASRDGRRWSRRVAKRLGVAAGTGVARATGEVPLAASAAEPVALTGPDADAIVPRNAPIV